MSPVMAPRERVLAALDHRQPDRVPLYFGGTSTFMTDTAYFRALKEWDLGEPVEPYRCGHTGNYVDNRILEFLGVDVRVLQMKIGLEVRRLSDRTVRSDWGIPLKMVDGYGSRINPPFESLNPECRPDEALEALCRHPWPDGGDPRRVRGLRTAALQFLDQGYALVGRSPQSASFLEYGCWLRGDANFYMDLMLNREFVHALFDRIYDVQKKFYESLLSECGDLLDIVETSEDYGTQSSLLISPDTFREFIKPRRERLNSFIRSKSPEIKILHHSCGAIETIIPDLLDTGIDILNPVQPGAGGMDPSAITEKYGKRCCFCGGIDMLQAVSGTRQEVEAEAALRIDQFRGRDGGYLLGTSNHIQSDTPLENLICLYKAGR